MSSLFNCQRNAEKTFKDALNLSQQKSGLYKRNAITNKSRVIFHNKYYPIRPNIKNTQTSGYIFDDFQVMNIKKRL